MLNNYSELGASGSGFGYLIISISLPQLAHFLPLRPTMFTSYPLREISSAEQPGQSVEEPFDDKTFPRYVYGRTFENISYARSRVAAGVGGAVNL